jgi:hypothetical protein
MLSVVFPVNISIKVSVELSIAEKLNEAQHFWIVPKSARIREVESPPLNLQTVVVVWLSNIAYNDPCLRSGGEFETTSCPQDRME